MKYDSARRAEQGFYHNGRARLPTEKILGDLPFIAWDGEGVNLRGEGKPQSYVLFGNSKTGPILSEKGLSTWECLDHIIETGIQNPHAVHVSFAFGYDSNMIVQNLALSTLGRLHRHGSVSVKHNGFAYTITYRKSKYFQVSRRGLKSDGSRSRSGGTSVKIYDLFTFFMSSFAKAYEKYVGPVPDVITQGKAGRSTFSIEEIDDILKYWTIEIQNIRELAEELRKRIYGAKLFITEWHGPGALASYALKQHNIKEHMKESNDNVRRAARYAYAAGRFETFRVGRFDGPIYGIDRNSAYPYALTQLPSLARGEWIHYTGPECTSAWGRDSLAHSRIPEFALCRVDLRNGGLLQSRPSPLFHRTKQHELSFPWHTRGWYWGCEARHAVAAGATILEAWVFQDDGTRPFDWIGDTYTTRKEWKAAGNAAELGLKLMMNSIYGKQAQRVGWDEKTGRIPGWHQLEWAGFDTALTRAALYGLMSQIPDDKLIAVETDGFYTTVPPEELGITPSEELGGWSVDVYDEVLYIQSGLAWLRQGNKWTPKRRGLDPGSFPLERAQAYVQSLQAHEKWAPYEGVTTRFTSIGQALQTREFFARHCVWVTAERSISVGRKGKRIHVPAKCLACAQGLSAWEMAHQLVITPVSLLTGPDSFPHDIPWEVDENPGVAEWREREYEEGLYA